MKRYGLPVLFIENFTRPLVIAAAALALFVPSQSLSAEPVHGGKITAVVEGDASGYDAIKGRALLGAGRTGANAIMERLFDRGEGGALIPVLGLSAIESDGGKSWKIALRQGVKFHDGTPFNADAVISHWSRLLNPENRFRGRMFLKPITSVKKTGDYEVTFHLKHAWLPFTEVITNDGSFTSFIPSPKAVADNTHHRSPVGTGPFMLKEWKPNDKLILTKNPNYWKEGKPYLDEIIVRVVPDHQTRYAVFNSGEADILFTDRPKHLKVLRDNPAYKLSIGETAGATILAMNTTKPPFDDERVRKALAYAYDQKMLIKVCVPDVSPYTEHWLGGDADFEDNGYLQPDLEKAKALLADYGKPVEFEYLHTATQRGKEAGVVLQQMFAKVGVKMTPKPQDFGAIIKSLFSKQYDVSSWVIAGRPDMGPRTMAAVHSKSPWNVMRYSNESVDKMLIKQRISTDPEERKDLLRKIVKEVNSAAPFLYFWRFRFHTVAKKNVMGVPPMEYGALHLANAWIAK